MAKATFVDGIDIVRGALDSVKEGQAKRARLVCKWHYWGWSEGATRNREIIKASQRMAHDIERVCIHPEEFGEEDIEQARIWQQKYAEYMKTIPKGSTQHYKFFGWMYTEIYRGMRRLEGEGMRG